MLAIGVEIGWGQVGVREGYDMVEYYLAPCLNV